MQKYIERWTARLSKVAVAVALGVAGYAGSASAGYHRDESINPEFAQAIADAPQFLALGDTSHPDLNIPLFVAQKSTIATLARAGVRHIFLERPVELQFASDALAQGDISSEEFIKTMAKGFHSTFQKTKEEVHLVHQATADTIENAADFGVKVHFVDMGAGIMGASSGTYSAFNREVEDAYVAYQKGGAEGNLTVSDFVTRYVGGLTKERLKNIQDQIMIERLGADDEVVKQIEAIAGTDKAVIFYGAHHADHVLPGVVARPPNSFEDLLKGRMAKIALCGKTPICEEDQKEWPKFKVPAYREVENGGPSRPMSAAQPLLGIMPAP